MMPSAPPLETAHAGDIVVTSVIVRGQVTAIDDAYQLDSTANANGFAHLVDTQAPPGTYQAVWTQQNGTPYCSSSVAFALGQ